VGTVSALSQDNTAGCGCRSETGRRALYCYTQLQLRRFGEMRSDQGKSSSEVGKSPSPSEAAYTRRPMSARRQLSVSSLSAPCQLPQLSALSSLSAPVSLCQPLSASVSSQVSVIDLLTLLSGPSQLR
jgi:hypothetical protein